MRHYRINKLAKVDGVVVKKKDILAGSDTDAVRQAADDLDAQDLDKLLQGTVSFPVPAAVTTKAYSQPQGRSVVRRPITIARLSGVRAHAARWPR